MTVKVLGAVAAAITVLLVVCMGALTSCGASGVLPASCVAATDATDGGVLGRHDSEQIRNVATIIAEGEARGVVSRGWVVAVATALQESNLRNLPHLGADNDHDSIGLFQQRPSQGWGTAEQLADPAYQAGKFFDTLLAVPGWQDMPLTEAAQAVQQSAYPDAYATHEQDAIALVAAVGGSMGLANAGAACGEWTPPVIAPIVSGFRTASRPGHNGVDLGAARNTLIVAASAGTVIAVRCNAHINGTPYSCDIDGSPTVSGCGWYVDIQHADRIITRYCHMQTRPWVAVGDTVVTGEPIGVVGTSGSSSGPHLHFEVHLGGDRSSAGAIDPEPYLEAVGAPLD
jgi:murein DD-endopeptidase MepM/ murein hydrolase activator NlpD